MANKSSLSKSILCYIWFQAQTFKHQIDCFKKSNSLLQIFLTIIFFLFSFSVLPPSQGDATKISDQKHSNPKAQETAPKQRLIHVDYDLLKVIFGKKIQIIKNVNFSNEDKKIKYCQLFARVT